MRTFPTAQPLLQARTEQVAAPASWWQEPRPWAHTGGGPEAAVCLGGEHFRDPLSPGALPGVGSCHGRQQMLGEAGEGQAPCAHRLPSGQQEGVGQSP